MWVTIKIMSELFEENQSEVQRHIKDIFEDMELDMHSSTQKIMMLCYMIWMF